MVMSDEKIKTAQEIADERAKAAEAPAAAAPPPEPAAVTIDAAELEKVRAKAAEAEAFREKYLRALADFDNYQKRARREQERYREEALRDVLRDLLLVVDNLELALEAARGKRTEDDLASLAKGVALVRDQLLLQLANRGAKPFEVAASEPFDTNVHEAVSAIETPGLARDEVAAVARRGFMLGPVLLRPAQVVVKKAAPPAAGAGGS